MCSALGIAAAGCSAKNEHETNPIDAQAGTGGAGSGTQTDGGAGTNGSSVGTGDAALSNDASVDDVDAQTPDAAVESPLPELPAFDCGENGIVLEGHGPPMNRVNYIIVGDGYTQEQLGTLYMQHLQKMLSIRFTAELEPYARYRNFVNICALKTPSQTSGIGTAPGNTAFSGYGNDDSRLGYVEDDKVRDAIKALLPAEIEVDWTAIVLNDDHWWNAGGRYMVWSGGHQDAALAAEHEGGHAFQKLADEYGGNCNFNGNENDLRVNVTVDPVDTGGKWKEWLGFDHTPGTGKQGAFEGAEYCDTGAWRPSSGSVMNILWDSSYFNAISREAAIRVIYDVVKPIDAAAPELQADGSALGAGVLWIKVVDPDVLKVDWSIDGKAIATDAGEVFDVAVHKLAAGKHTITARAYDDTPWLRGDRSALEESRTWNVVVP